MTHIFRYCLSLMLLALPLANAWADAFDDTIEIFEEAGESDSYFDKSYGYAVSRISARAASVSAAPMARDGSMRAANMSAIRP